MHWEPAPAVQDTGKFGEIRALLLDGWSAFSVPGLRSRIAEIVRVRREAVANNTSKMTTRWTVFIALIAGLLAVPSTVEAVMKPLWKYYGLPRPANADLYQLLLVGISIASIGLLLSGGYLWSRRVQ